jgi:glycosyltransferase involved in cell wall biosynthesis
MTPPTFMAPTFTVILPVYNRATSLAPALESVLAQTHAPLEVIVLDDGSTDDLVTALLPYADRIASGQIRVIRQANAGVAAARNAAATAAKGQWLTFQDSDDLWTAGHLAFVARDLAAAADQATADQATADRATNGDIVAHLGDVTYVGAGYAQGLFAIKQRPFPKGHAVRVSDPLPLVISGMTLQAAAIRADVFARLGGFDQEMRMLSDTAFFCQLALEGSFLVTGDEMAQIQRLEGDTDSITSLHRKNALYARQMHVRILAKLRARALRPDQERLVDRLLSGAEFRMAEVLRRTDRPAARRVLIQSARRHPRPTVGWIKAILAASLGARGFQIVSGKNRALDRS